MPRILILDSDVSLVTQTLVGADHEVFCTRNPDAAVRIARDLNPQIVLAELTLGGLDLCHALRKAGNDAFFMLVSGRIMREQAGEVSSVGVDEYVLKPIRPRTLLERVEAAMVVVTRRSGAAKSSRGQGEES